MKEIPENDFLKVNQNIIDILYNLLERLVYNPIIALINNRLSMFNQFIQPQQQNQNQFFNTALIETQLQLEIQQCQPSQQPRQSERKKMTTSRLKYNDKGNLIN